MIGMFEFIIGFIALVGFPFIFVLALCLMEIICVQIIRIIRVINIRELKQKQKMHLKRI